MHIIINKQLKMDVIKIFGDRMRKIGIEVLFAGNVPWIYLYKVNGNLVKEKFMSEHGFTAAFMPVAANKPTYFTDIGELFKIIRKYSGRDKNVYNLSVNSDSAKNS
jgi:hypothetical protein